MNIAQVSSTTSVVVMQGAYRFFFTDDAPFEVDNFQTWESPYRVVGASDVVLATEPPVDDWLKFQRLVKQWRVERGARSSITEAVLCPAYQSVIGMGPTVVPFILAQLESEGDDPDHWFWALKAITGADPVNDHDRGNLRLMALAWRQLGQLQGHAW